MTIPNAIGGSEKTRTFYQGTMSRINLEIRIIQSKAATHVLNVSTPPPLIDIDTNFLMFLTQDKSNVIHSVAENITNIDATTKQNRAIRLVVNKNILSIFTPIKSYVALEYRTSVKFQTC